MVKLEDLSRIQFFWKKKTLVPKFSFVVCNICLNAWVTWPFTRTFFTNIKFHSIRMRNWQYIEKMSQTAVMQPLYGAFQKYTKSEVHKPPSQLCFLLLSIVITFISNESWHADTHKTWSFESVKVNYFSLKGPLIWVTTKKTQTSVGFWTSEFA